MLDRSTTPKSLFQFPSTNYIMDKKRMNTYYQSIVNNYILGIGSVALFSDRAVRDTIHKLIDLGDTRTLWVDQVFTFDLSLPANLLQMYQEKFTEKKRLSILFNYYFLFFHASFTKAFELVKDYCEQTNQLEKLFNESWFFDARIVRNSFSHDFKIKYTKNDLTQLPFKWEKITLNELMNHKPLDKKIFNLQTLTELFNAIGDFASSIN